MTITTDNEACHQGILADPTDVTYRRAYADLMLEDSDPESQEIGEAMHWLLDRPEKALKVTVTSTKWANSYAHDGGLWDVIADGGITYAYASENSISLPISRFVCKLWGEYFCDDGTSGPASIVSTTFVFVRGGWPEFIVVDGHSPADGLVKSSPIGWITASHKQPIEDEGALYSWYKLSETGWNHLSHDILLASVAPDLFDHMAAASHQPKDSNSMHYKKKERALKALSNAMIAKFRGKVAEC